MPKSTPVVIPRENINDEFVALVGWLVDNGAWVDTGQGLAEVETSKAVFDIPAPVAGTVQYSLEAGADVEVGGVLCFINSDDRASLPQVTELSSNSHHASVVSVPAEEVPAPFVQAAPMPTEQRDNASSASRHQLQTRFSQKAQELLQQRGLEAQMFAGRGLVRTHHILDALGESNPEVPPSRGVFPEDAAGRTLPAPVPAAGVAFHTEPLSRNKRTEVRYLSSSYHNTLASVVTIAVPTHGLRAAATRYTPTTRNSTAIILFEVARLLRQFPHFNAFYADGNVNVYDEVHIGFAVDAGRGLKVPVIHNADTKGMQDVATAMQELLVCYLDDQLPVESLTGGTFTITDLSSEGVFTFHPLINQGQSAILGVGGEFFLPGSREGLFNLILSFDHQLSEGRQAAQFLNELRQRLQAYEQVLEDRTSSDEVIEESFCVCCLTPLDTLKQRDQFLLQVMRSEGRVEYMCNICAQGW